MAGKRAASSHVFLNFVQQRVTRTKLLTPATSYAQTLCAIALVRLTLYYSMRKLILLGPILIIFAFGIANRSYVLDDILFDPNSSELTDKQIQELKIIIKTIRESLIEGSHKTFTLWINGNSDPSE